MKAVVLAAGRGTRLGELARDRPKALLTVGGEPLLALVLRGIAAAGIRDIAVVVGYLGDQVRAAFASSEVDGARLCWFEQREPEGTARAVLLARSLLGEEPFLFAWADVLVGPATYRAVVEGAAGTDGALAVNRVDDPSAGAAVYLDAQGFVSRIVEKPAPGTSATRWNNAGIGVLPPGAWRQIEALRPSARGEYELPQAIDALVGEGCRLRAVPVEGPWFDIGTPESLAAARASFGGA